MSDLIDEAHEFLCIMDKQEYADEVYRLRADLKAAKQALENQIAHTQTIADEQCRLRAANARLQAWHDAVVAGIIASTVISEISGTSEGVSQRIVTRYASSLPVGTVLIPRPQPLAKE